VNVVVKARQGEVRGTLADGVHAFKGIPYAAPPSLEAVLPEMVLFMTLSGSVR
jgi:hypothetical protein